MQTLFNYTNSFVSKYHPWFVELGYPELDVRFVHSHDATKRIWGHETGEWAIIEMLSGPYISAEVLWRDVLTGLKNIEINKGTLKRFAESIDIKKQAIWDRELAKSLAVEAEHAAAQKHRDDMLTKVHESYIKNPDLMNRVAKNGVGELHPASVFRHIPKSRF